ncbi:MAG: serine/threonine-protein kinase [Candidatus Acidiferrum sp.]|jgi:serine/threonine-protein kinase
MQVGRYEIIDVIGTGANSKVVRAHDPMIGRIVAIKLFSPGLAQGAGRDKFLQEARVVGQLSHPCVVTLHDMGIDEATQTPYLVMEFLEGQPLDKLLGKGSIPLPRACAWVGEIASALHLAHRRGVIHGDIKPANILILDDGRVKLTDFGMARLASHDKKDTPLLGTPAYWCPEQIIGRSQDARSDIFSLGVVLYEMVTGKRPFDSDSLQGICTRVLSSKPLPVSQANPSVPTAFDSIVAKCLEKDPGHRYPSVDLLAAELYPLARRKPSGQPQAHTSTFRERATRLLRSA